MGSKVLKVLVVRFGLRSRSTNKIFEYYLPKLNSQFRHLYREAKKKKKETFLTEKA